MIKKNTSSIGISELDKLESGSEEVKKTDVSFINNLADRVMGKESSYDVLRAEAHGFKKGSFRCLA